MKRDQKALARDEREPLPPTQIGRALQELGIARQDAHSRQAKGRVERSFGTAQDRLVKGLRVSGACTAEDANRYLEEHFLPWWNQHLVVAPANPTDAHRPLGAEHNLAASLSRVEARQVDNDYTVPVDGKKYRLMAKPMPAELRGATVRIERRLDGSLAVRFRDRYLKVEECAAAVKVTPVVPPPKPPRARRRWTPGPPLGGFTKECSQTKNPPRRRTAEGHADSSEPAPSHRPWASAWARPRADDFNLTSTSPLCLVKRTFLFGSEADISTWH